MYISVFYDGLKQLLQNGQSTPQRVHDPQGKNHLSEGSDALFWNMLAPALMATYPYTDTNNDKYSLFKSPQ